MQFLAEFPHAHFEKRNPTGEPHWRYGGERGQGIDELGQSAAVTRPAMTAVFHPGARSAHTLVGVPELCLD